MSKAVLVCGDRFWGRVEAAPEGRYASNASCFDTMRSVLEFVKAVGFDVIIEGEAPGADTMSREIGTALGFEVIKEPADWKRYKGFAGPVRNAKMLTFSPSLVVAFHNDISQSRGTANMIGQAKDIGIPVVLVGEMGDIQFSIPSKASTMFSEGLKGHLIDMVHGALNTKTGECPYTRDDAEEFVRNGGSFDALH